MKKHLKRLTAAVLSLTISFAALTTPASAAEGSWKKDSTGWWYSCADGSYPRDTWKKIDGQWYAFDANGYMETEWLRCKGNWYYLGQDGAMRTGWARAGHPSWGTWYYFSADGVMQTGWLQDRGSWYYLQEQEAAEGALLTNGDLTWNGNLYHFDGSGRMAQNEAFIWKNYVGTADTDGKVTQDIRFTGLEFDCPKGWELWQEDIGRYLLLDGTGFSISVSACILPEETAALSFDAYRDLKLQQRAAVLDADNFKVMDSDILTPESLFSEAFVSLEHLNTADTPSWRDFCVCSGWLRDDDVELLVSATFSVENEERFMDAVCQVIRSLRILREGKN